MFDKITNARKALYDTGLIVLVGNRMVAKKESDKPIADAYNRLAELHLNYTPRKKRNR